MADPVRIEIRKVLFANTSPQIVVPPTAINRKRPLVLKPSHTEFIVDIAIKENLQVRLNEWEKPSQGAVNALVAIPTIDSLKVNVTFESKIFSVGQTEPKAIPTEAVDIIVGCFSRLRGVAHADVSGLGADEDCQALVAQLTEPVKEVKAKKSSEERAFDDEAEDAEEDKSDSKQSKITARPIKRVRRRTY